MNCLLCQKKMGHLVADLFACETCGLISSNLTPNPHIYNRNYIIKYEMYTNTPIGTQLTELRYGLMYKYALGKRVLDFGCGAGDFVRRCNSDGFEAYGYDINPYSKFWDNSTLLEPYDIVTFWDVLEHLSKPLETVKDIKADYLFVSTPATDDFQTKLKQLTKGRHYRPREHLNYFNHTSLSKFFILCGYSILETSYAESALRRGGGDKNILTMVGVRA